MARVDADLVAFQEDCAGADGVAQAEEVAGELAAFSRRGYEVRRAETHQAQGEGEVFSEGISLLSAYRIEAEHTLALASEHFPRKALAADVTVRGVPLHFYATHFDSPRRRRCHRAPVTACPRANGRIA